MKKLLKTATGRSHYVFLFLFSIGASLLFTLAGQLEMFSLGVITKKGPEFFELFAPKKEGRLTQTPQVTRQQMDERFREIDTKNRGVITKEEAEQFLSSNSAPDIVSKGIRSISSLLPIEKSVWNLCFALIFVALFKAITLFAYRMGTRLLAIRISQDLRQEYFNHLQYLPMSFYQNHNIGSLSSRAVTDATMIADGINSSLINYLQTPFAVLSTFTICFIISWQLSLAVFFGFPLLVIPIVFLARRIKRIAKQIQKKQEALASVLVEFISGIQTIKVFAMEDFSKRKYQEHNDQMALLERKSARYDIAARPVLHTIGVFCLVTALMFGLYGLNLPLHEVLFYCGLLTTVYEPIKKFAEENGRIQRGIAASERMSEVLEVPSLIAKKDKGIDIRTFSDCIEFDNVWFSYGSQWVLKGVSFRIKKGETVAIVGPTGAGKSTIVQLLARLYEIQKGEIRIDGKPLSAYSLKSLREFFAYVPQKPFLFFDTVAENISFGRSFSEEEIRGAAERAHAAEFICQLPEKYNTLLAEAGKSLSGGQQQRLAIARAFIKNAPVLVMDEATSSLDATSENYIKQAIRELNVDVTKIIIAHRLSTIEDASRILYLEHGVKRDEGKISELLERCEPFRSMWDLLKLETV
jgi:ABC-type multidrug transport system fused ATPase/permease subunit